MATWSETRVRGRGFRRTSVLVERRIRAIGESRGFAVSRLLTHWAEIAGSEIARHTRPAEVRYGRSGLGATLTLLTSGAHAPMVEMQKEAIRTRVNACYGYAAISAIRITQTAPQGFSDGQASFAPAPPEPDPAPSPAAAARAAEVAAGVTDDGLRRALEALGTHVLARHTG